MRWLETIFFSTHKTRPAYKPDETSCQEAEKSNTRLPAPELAQPGPSLRSETRVSAVSTSLHAARRQRVYSALPRIRC